MASFDQIGFALLRLLDLAIDHLVYVALLVCVGHLFHTIRKAGHLVLCIVRDPAGIGFHFHFEIRPRALVPAGKECLTYSQPLGIDSIAAPPIQSSTEPQ